MDNLSKEMRLIAAVVAHEAGVDKNTCALMRAYEDDDGESLHSTASRLGFSKVESLGIMDGWDTAGAGHTVSLGRSYRRVDPEAYDRGYALGARCWEAVSVRTSV